MSPDWLLLPSPAFPGPFFSCLRVQSHLGRLVYDQAHCRRARDSWGAWKRSCVTNDKPVLPWKEKRRATGCFATLQRRSKQRLRHTSAWDFLSVFFLSVFLFPFTSLCCRAARPCMLQWNSDKTETGPKSTPLAVEHEKQLVCSAPQKHWHRFSEHRNVLISAFLGILLQGLSWNFANMQPRLKQN